MKKTTSCLLGWMAGSGKFAVGAGEGVDMMLEGHSYVFQSEAGYAVALRNPRQAGEACVPFFLAHCLPLPLAY